MKKLIGGLGGQNPIHSLPSRQSTKVEIIPHLMQSRLVV